MRSSFLSPASSVFIRVHLWTIFLLAFAALLAGCSIPNLETSACLESRSALREFYSYHFGNSMTFSREDLKAREKYLTPELAEKLRGSQDGTDPLTTGTSDIPKAFRAAECRESSPSATSIDVVLFWKDDTRTEERKIKVEMTKRGDAWFVAAIAR